jgi:NTP pyrophosphatase (non-canonical NTP hydrolase)
VVERSKSPIDKIVEINNSRDERFTSRLTPFTIITRLVEESGELAKEINRFEQQGSKLLRREKGNKETIAHEITDVLAAAIHLAQYYNCVDLVLKSIDESHKRIK